MNSNSTVVLITGNLLVRNSLCYVGALTTLVVFTRLRTVVMFGHGIETLKIVLDE